MKKKLMSMTLAAGMIAALIAPSAAFAAQSVGRVYDLEAEREGAYVELEWDEVYGSDGYQILRSDSKTELTRVSSSSKAKITTNTSTKPHLKTRRTTTKSAHTKTPKAEKLMERTAA